MPTHGYAISEIAARLGLTPRALRYYEEIGLVEAGRTRLTPPPPPQAACRDLEAIAQLRRAGVDLETIRWVLETQDKALRANRISTAANKRLAVLDAETAALRALFEIF